MTLFLSGGFSAGKGVLKVLVREQLERHQNVVVIGPQAREFEFVSGNGHFRVRIVDFAELLFWDPSFRVDEFAKSDLIAKKIANMLMRYSPDIIIVDGCDKNGVFAQITSNLVSYALTGGKLVIESHSDMFDKALIDLERVGINITEREVKLVIALQRDLSLGRMFYETVYVSA